jgi:C-terminal processing protease CtpA/Prc
LDIRFNGGGELKNSILLYSYMAGAPYRFTKQLEMASINQPTYSRFTNYDQALKHAPINRKHVLRRSEKVFDITGHFSQRIGKPKKDGFKGNLIILVNGNTASASGALVSCIKNDKRGLIVGEENRDNYTGFSAGVPVVLTLPNSGITVSIPIRKFTYAAGEDTGRGVVPDYFVASTANDFFKQENVLLNFAIELLRK